MWLSQVVFLVYLRGPLHLVLAASAVGRRCAKAQQREHAPLDALPEARIPQRPRPDTSDYRTMDKEMTPLRM